MTGQEPSRFMTSGRSGRMDSGGRIRPILLVVADYPQITPITPIQKNLCNRCNLRINRFAVASSSLIHIRVRPQIGAHGPVAADTRQHPAQGTNEKARIDADPEHAESLFQAAAEIVAARGDEPAVLSCTADGVFHA